MIASAGFITILLSASALKIKDANCWLAVTWDPAFKILLFIMPAPQRSASSIGYTKLPMRSALKPILRRPPSPVATLKTRATTYSWGRWPRLAALFPSLSTREGAHSCGEAGLRFFSFAARPGRLKRRAVQQADNEVGVVFQT